MGADGPRATPRDIVSLVLSQSLRPIAVGVLTGGGLAAVTATVLLSTPAAETIGALVRALPVAGVRLVISPSHAFP